MHNLTGLPPAVELPGPLVVGHAFVLFSQSYLRVQGRHRQQAGLLQSLMVRLCDCTHMLPSWSAQSLWLLS